MSARQTRSEPSRLLLIFLGLAVAIVLLGWMYYRTTAEQFRREAAQQISTVADLKVSELVTWQRERFSDARFYLNNLSLARLVRDAFARPDDVAVQRELRSWFADTQQSHGYGVFLVDRTGAVHLSLPAEQAPLDELIRAQVVGVLAKREPRLVDFYRSDAGDAIHLALMMPLRSVVEGDPPEAVLVWRLDPALSLYPMLAQWPTSSTSSEAMLVRRDGNDSLVLNPLRRDPTTALSLRMSLELEQLPSVRAALGDEGVLSTLDYRDIPVVAALRQIPNTPWHLAVRIDQAEVYGPLRERLWWLVALIGALLAASAAGIAVVWRQQWASFYASRLRAEAALREQAEELRHAHETLSFHLDNSPLGVVEWDLRLRVLRWSPQAEAIFGWSADEVRGRHPSEWNFVPAEDVPRSSRSLPTSSRDARHVAAT